MWARGCHLALEGIGFGHKLVDISTLESYILYKRGLKKDLDGHTAKDTRRTHGRRHWTDIWRRYKEKDLAL